MVYFIMDGILEVMISWIFFVLFWSVNLCVWVLFWPPKLWGAISSSFLNLWEQFKKLQMCPLMLHTLPFDIKDKESLLSEMEVTDTLNV